MSYHLLQDYLDSILVEDNPVALPEIKSRLSTLSNYCVSCHTQDSEFRSLFKESKNLVFQSNLSRADFNYATRNYREAHKYYEKYLFTEAALSDADVLYALHKILSIYTQVLNEPMSGIKALNRIGKEKTFSKGIEKFIVASKEALMSLDLSHAEDKKLVSFEELSGYVSEYIGGISLGQGIFFTNSSEKIERLWLRGLIFRYLNDSPKQDEMPYILYWLALCDLSLGHGYDYALADFYIKQCITRFPTHPFAQQCFNEYKDYVTFYYTTPNETILPFEVNNELKELENHLKLK